MKFNKRLVIGILVIILGIFMIIFCDRKEEKVLSEYEIMRIENGVISLDKQNENIYVNIEYAIDYLMKQTSYKTFDITYNNNNTIFGTSRTTVLFDSTEEWGIEITDSKILLYKVEEEEDYEMLEGYEETEED